MKIRNNLMLQPSVFHLFIDNSSIMSTLIKLKPKTDFSFMAMRIAFCQLQDSYIWKSSKGGIVSALIEHCSFVPVTPVYIGLDFIEAFHIVVRNCKIHTFGAVCASGCGIYLEGTEILNEIMPDLRKILKY